ncbi:hypothetical protein MNBD_GAMMA17-296 [hydrothermal vent metagenome]|uniref:RDD domain-containing protein n=1 Tax=hydrothermal vent metagenome TaxID=652676 RepID=A0A3B1A1Q8_9ZZZZ
MLDTRHIFETPEGIDLGLGIAGPVVRAQAWLIDLAIRFVLYLVLGIAFSFLGKLGQGIFLVLVFLGEWFYPVLFEMFKGGATPGKRRMEIKVINDNGTPVSWSASIVRNLLRTVDFLPFLYGFGLFSILINRDFKRLGDLAAGTLVVYAEPVRAAPLLIPGGAEAPPRVLTLEEQRAVLEFSERSLRLSPERREELAALLQPLTQKQGEEAVKLLYRYANWLQGQT